ncbi:hypothetical protein RJ641_036085 [Dillenia turbinata]|uniref:DUF2470 domain-containing protein n=1 Tax=Dillenia turbinata TaxID=194707 RepID=A0AAN8VP43_9MAGN
MKANKATILSYAEKCKNILVSNWTGQLNTIKADAKGSKEDIHSSKVKYLFKKGKPFIWVPKNDQHNVNTIIDERGSFAVASPLPGKLAYLLKSIKRLPTRVALTGDAVPLKDDKIDFAAEILEETISSEIKVISNAGYSVSGILSSCNLGCASRSENLLELFNEDEEYTVYKFNIRACTFLDGNGRIHEVEVEGFEASKADVLSPYYASLIDGINQSEARRRALMLFCFTYLNANVKDAYMLSVDRRGFDVLGKVPSQALKNGLPEYQWKEFRFTFKDAAHDIESFCNQLVEMEEEAVKSVSNFSGLG